MFDTFENMLQSQSGLAMAVSLNAVTHFATEAQLVHITIVFRPITGNGSQKTVFGRPTYDEINLNRFNY